MNNCEEYFPFSIRFNVDGKPVILDIDGNPFPLDCDDDPYILDEEGKKVKIRAQFPIETSLIENFESITIVKYVGSSILGVGGSGGLYAIPYR